MMHLCVCVQLSKSPPSGFDVMKQHNEDTDIREEILGCTKKHLSHEIRNLFEAFLLFFLRTSLGK